MCACLNKKIWYTYFLAPIINWPMKLASHYGSFPDFCRWIGMHRTTFTENVRNFLILKNLPQTIFCLLPDGRKIAIMSLKNDILTCLVRSKKLFWGHLWGWPSDFTPKMSWEPQKVTTATIRAQNATSSTVGAEDF